MRTNDGVIPISRRACSVSPECTVVIPIAAARQQSEDAALMFEWFDRVGYDADIAALRRDFSEVRWHSFADWAREFDWSVLERTSSVA